MRAIRGRWAHLRPEAAGWDAIFLWDHLLRPVTETTHIGDAWISLAAIAGKLVAGIAAKGDLHEKLLVGISMLVIFVYNRWGVGGFAASRGATR